MSYFGEINTDKKFVHSISIIFILFFIITTLLKYGILPLFHLSIGGIDLPDYQTTIALFVFPSILIITYIFFVRKGHIKFQQLGFNTGRKGLLNTLSLGLLGGLLIMLYNSIFTQFVIQQNVIPNFIEKCIFAPIWEEFYHRVLFLTIIELVIILYAKRFYFDNPKYKDKDSEFTRKFNWYGFYFFILFIGAMWFMYWHDLGYVSNILFSGIIAGFVYLKTRSIIAPIIVHSMSNLVTGGFFFLMIQYFTG